MPPEAPAQPRLYKELRVLWGIPQEVQAQAEHALAWLAAAVPHWDAGSLRVEWFQDASPTDRLGDPGVFETEGRAWACVRESAPRVIWLHEDSVRRPRRAFVRSVLHEAAHAHQFAKGLQRTRTGAQLEAMADELLGVFAPELAGVPADAMG